jgi:restriction system protein
MEYVSQRFENSRAGIAQKDTFSAKVAAQGYRIVSEQAEAGHAKGEEQCCLFVICMPCVFLAGRTPGTILVTYGRDVSGCPTCGSPVIAGRGCEKCQRLANDKGQQAANGTAEARKSRQKLETLLVASMSIDYRFDWQFLRKEFQEPAPQALAPPKPVSVPTLVRIVVALPVLERMIPALRRYHLRWTEAREQDAQQQAEAREKYTNALADWQKAKESFGRDQTADVEAKKGQYLSKDRSALVDYWKKVLEKPVYLEQPPCLWKLDYNDETNRLVVEYALPPISLLPRIEEVKYRPALNVVEELPYPPARFLLLYADLLVKTTLIVLFKLFQSDAAGALDSIALNGTVTVIDPATGHPKSPCVLAIEVEKSLFSNIEFSQVDPMACFKGLNGTISPDLAVLDPINQIT